MESLVAKSNVARTWLQIARNKAIKSIATKEAMEADVRELTKNLHRVTLAVRRWRKWWTLWTTHARELRMLAGSLSSQNQCYTLRYQKMILEIILISS